MASNSLYSLTGTGGAWVSGPKSFVSYPFIFPTALFKSVLPSCFKLLSSFLNSCTDFLALFTSNFISMGSFPAYLANSLYFSYDLVKASAVTPGVPIPGVLKVVLDAYWSSSSLVLS